MPGFFDDYPQFFTTSKTTADARRLNFRYHLIIEQNIELLKDKRIVEVASHDGRWAFAALRGAGAAHVTGIEPRQHLVDNAGKTLTGYDVPETQFDFICGDGFVETERLAREGQRFDTAMILGFLYHTARQYEIIHKCAELGVKSIIVDTAVLPDVTQPIVRVGMERTGPEAQLHAQGKKVDLGGVPSITAVHLMLKAAGFAPAMRVQEMPPPVQGGGDYREGRRFTFVGTR